MLDRFLLKRFEVITINSSDLLNYIIGGLGIAGIFLGLYGSNIMSIYSAKYTDAPKRIRELFEKDRLTTKIVNTISQTVDKVHFMDDVYSLFFYNRFMKTNARSDSYDV